MPDAPPVAAPIPPRSPCLICCGTGTRFVWHAETHILARCDDCRGTGLMPLAAEQAVAAAPSGVDHENLR